jgi:hypothetical protein
VVLPHDRASGGRVAPVTPLAVTLVCDGCTFLATERA